MSGQLKNDTEERKLRVTLLSVGWKASCNGDLTTINRELAIQMAKHPNVEVSVFLPWCSEEDKKDADGYNVKLIEAVKLPGLKPVLWLASVPDGHAMDCILGHGVDLGQQIPLIKRNPNYSNCRWIQVVHTVPEEIGMYKSISEGQQMQQTEIELCKMADQVVTIGPKLTDAYKHQLRKQDVFNLTPSILSEFSDVQQVNGEERTFCVLVTESGDSEDFYVKGYDIAAKAIAELKDKSYQLRFASKQRGKEDELANKLLQCGIGRNQLMICSFDENRETLANLFSAVDIAILPSKTEGFGLSALEAISAGLPVLVSGNSGIAEALRKVPIGSHCIVDSEDPAEWAQAIKAVRYKERNVRLAEARILRENYFQQFSWEKPCNSLVKKMYNLAFGGEMNIKVDVKYLKPKEQNVQTGMLATESIRCQEVQQPRASATSAASGSVSHLQTEDIHALREKTFLSIIRDSFYNTNPKSIEECNWFMEYTKKMKLTITGVDDGSLIIKVKCESLMILEELWTDYSSGHLGEVVQNCFVTEKILKELNLAELRLKTTMDIEEYYACKMFFEKDALRGALSSEFHSASSTSESPQKKEQWEKSELKTKIMEKVKLEGTSPLIVVPTTGHGKELEESWGRKGMLPLPGSSTFDPDEELVEPCLKRQRMEGASSSEFHSISSTSESPQIQEELKKWKQKTKIVETEKLRDTSPLTVIPTTGHGKELMGKAQGGKGMLPLLGSSTSDSEESEVESFTSDSEEEPEEMRMKLQIMKGASSSEFHSISSTSESPQKQEELKKWKQKTKIVDTEKLKGSSSPPLLPTTDFEEKLVRVCEDLKMLRVEGGFPVLLFSTVDLEKKLAKVCIEHQRLRIEGTLHPLELFTADLKDEIKGLRNELFRLRMKGSSHPLVSTIEVELDGLLKQLSKWRKEGSFPVLQFSTIDLEKKLAELSMELQRLRMEEKLKGLLTELERRRDKGSLPPIISTIEVELEEQLKKLQKTRMEVMLPLPGSSIFDLEEKLRKVGMEMELEMMEGSFSVLELSTIDLEKKLPELSMKLQRLRMEGTLPPPELFTADLEDELERLIELLMLEPREGMKDTVFTLRQEFEKVKMEALENAMYPTIRPGLAKFDVSLPEELQNYVSYLLDESAKLHLRKQVLQPPRALEELREAMDKDELKTFLTIHIREGAWQVVLLFTDELPRVKLPRDWCDIIHIEDEDEDEDEEVSNEVIYSSTSGILKAWPTKYDPSLVTLCNAITNKDWKVTRLILSLSRIPDEGLKNLSTALTQSELYSLTLHETALQSQGLKHLCNALTSVNCRLTNLNVRGNELGDVGIMHLCNALTSVDCTLTSLNVRCNNLGDVGIRHLCNALTSVNCRLTNLNVSLNKLGDVGIMHLCNALTSVDCTLTSLNVSNSELGDVGIRHLSKALNSVNCRLTSLNVSANQFGDNGLKHLCDALTSRNCALTKLKVRLNRLGDRGIKELSEVLTSGFCTLTSLDVSCNKFGDVGIKHLCKALTDTKCKLRSLNLCSNRYVTEDGKKYLSQMLTGTDWEDKGALRLSRSTTK